MKKYLAKFSKASELPYENVKDRIDALLSK